MNLQSKNSGSGIAYDTTKGNLGDLKDTDNAEPLMKELDTTKKAKDGLFRKYWSNGQLRYEWEYKDGERADGTSKSWWPNGQLKQINIWNNGFRTGLQTTWHENGKKKNEGIDNHGNPEGKTTHWYETGQKHREENYKKGVKDGLYTEWYANGQKKFEVIYKKGLYYELNSDKPYSGEVIVYYDYENEDKYFEGNYKDGKEDGLWTYWYRNGQLEKKIIYENGRKIST
jgi:antitoxin component YwqK of YwqJK toxin-antitoxin module